MDRVGNRTGKWEGPTLHIREPSQRQPSRIHSLSLVKITEPVLVPSRLTSSFPPAAMIFSVTTSIAFSSTDFPKSLSSVMVSITYRGGAISLIWMGVLSSPTAFPAINADLTASIPSYV